MSDWPKIYAADWMPKGVVMLVPERRANETETEWLKRCVRIAAPAEETEP